MPVPSSFELMKTTDAFQVAAVQQVSDIKRQAWNSRVKSEVASSCYSPKMHIEETLTTPTSQSVCEKSQ